MAGEIRIVIADDHAIVRQGLRTFIEQQQSFKLVGEAPNGRMALKLIQSLQPDVAVVDLTMPELDGLQLAQEAIRLGLAAKFIVLTVHCDHALLDRALESGVRGYVLKESALTDIVEAIERVARGESYASPAIGGFLMERRRQAVGANTVQLLTPAERQVLRLIAEYKTSSEIGESLHISARTVDTHRTNICMKLELRGKHALMKFAASHLSEI